MRALPSWAWIRAADNPVQEWDKWPGWIRHGEEASRETDGEARRGGPSGKKNKLQKESALKGVGRRRDWRAEDMQGGQMHQHCSQLH